MSWKKHFRVVNSSSPNGYFPNDSMKTGAAESTSSKYASYLPEVYAGHPNRIQRYYQYDDMDRDSDINAALDTISDFCTQSEEQNEEPFEVMYNEEANETEVTLLKENLHLWVKRNDFKSRLWYMIRGTIKNGDTFFLRDPETGEWLWIDHYSVEMVKVDETRGKVPDEYVVRGLDINRQAKFATRAVDPTQYRTPFGTNMAPGARPVVAQTGAANMFSMAGANRDPRQTRSSTAPDEMSVVDAEHVIHLSLSVGMDINWPFGQSILEPIFKTYKQKELLEDSIIIYRVQRAPERRIFYIDVGTMPPVRAKEHIERIKNEIHQRRIPNRTGGGASIMDAAYNPLCLDLSTKIPLLDGRTLTISELAEEYQNGKENWVYSCDPVTGAIVPGNITWAGVTRKDAEVITITLDNGETITCTPDHKIPVLGKGFVEAQHLTSEDSLISFETRQKNIDRRLKNERTYTQVYDHETNEWIYAHRMVGEFFRKQSKHQEFLFLPENADVVKDTIHHKDYDRYNNDPRNLTYMSKDDHIAYHVFQKKDYWDNITADERTRITSKISESLRSYYANMSVEDKQKFSELASVRSKKVHADMRENDPEAYQNWMDKFHKSRSEFLKNNPDEMKKAVARLGNYQSNCPNYEYRTSQRQLQLIVEAVNTVGRNRLTVMAHVSNDQRFHDAVLADNPLRENTNNKIDYRQLTDKKLKKIFRDFGFKNWKDFVAKVPVYNHRIVSIEKTGTMDVGTITVDGNERWHAHHTFATAAGIFVKNSIVEDYFFAQSADGRGSKVETLPGGDNLGEIGDLTFFTKKMARGLRIPSSYLALGDEDNGGGASYNDGKLGAAVIQEFRFNKYCMRIQSLLCSAFDKDFKRFLKENGIEIESSLFELRFNPPQNFTKYRQIELDLQQMQVFTQIQGYNKLAERFKLKRFLNLSEDEIIENERMWKEENPAKLKKSVGSTSAEADPEGDLGSVGLRMPGDIGLDGGEPLPDEGLEGQGGPETGPGGEGAGGPPAAAPPAGAGAAPPPGGGGPL